MQYLLMIYENEQQRLARSEEDQKRLLAEYFEYTNQIREAGQHIAGDALQPTTTATSVRVRNGKTLTTDGPFAETKEQLGGYYLVEAKDLDEAIGLAARIPGAREGTIEVRPILVFD